MLNPYTAGIDIGSEFHWACVNSSIVKDNIRSICRHVQHMQRALHHSNIRLDKAVSDITGKTGMAIIWSILRGERAPLKLAKLRDGRLKATEKEVAAALDGDYRREHMFMLRKAYDAYEFEQNQVLECDRRIKELLGQLNKKIDSSIKPLHESNSGVKRASANQPKFDPGILDPVLWAGDNIKSFA